jgi:hypothetical protein
MTGNLTPTTMPDWMSNINRRMAHIERHRHSGSGGGDNSVTLDNKWFRAEAARVDTTITAGDGAFSRVPLATATDPFQMLDENFTFIAPRDGAVQFSGAVSVNLNGPGSGNVFAILYDSTTSITELRSTQFASPTPVWPGGLDQVHVLSGIVEVIEGHTYTFWCFVSSPGNTKKFASYPENTFLTGTYIDGGSTPGDKGEPGPPGPPGTSGAGLDSSWRYLNYVLEPRLSGNITAYDTQGRDWGSGRFRRDGSGCVFLEGLFQYTGTPPFPIFTLPVGFRPATRQIYSVYNGTAVPSQIDVQPTGVVNFLSAPSNVYISITGISFMAEDALPVTWTPVTLMNGWTDFIAGEPAGYFIDSMGDVHLHGLIKGGNGQAFALPLGTYSTDGSQLFITAANSSVGGQSGLARVDVNVTGTVVLGNYSGGGTNAWVSLAGIVIANPTGTWTATRPPMTNGWVNYAGGWAPLATCVNRNGVMAMRGLIANGTVGVPTNITVAGVIPPRYSPTQSMMFLNGAGGSASGARVDVRNDGSLAFVGFANGGTNVWMGTVGRWFVGAEGSAGSVGQAGPKGDAGTPGTPGTPGAPGGAPQNVYYLARRGPNASDTYVPGSFAPLLTLSLPADAPAGYYSLDVAFAVQSQSSAAGNLRILWGGMFLNADMRCDVQPLLCTIAYNAVVGHSGGAVTIAVSHQVGGGAQTITVHNPNTSVRAIYLGP